jgi:hypothetical protein
MKYSKEIQKLHLEFAYGILLKEPSTSSRELCRELEEQHKLKLSRGYVTKLMWKACERLTKDEKDRVQRTALLLLWKEKAKKLTDDYWRELRAHFHNFPVEEEHSEEDIKKIMAYLEDVRRQGGY